MIRNVWFRENRDTIYYILLGGFTAGLCCSKFLMSLTFISYAIIFILVGDYGLFRERLLKNKGWISLLLLLLLLHVLSLLWTDDLHAGWNALRVRLSFFLLPILITTTLGWDKNRITQWIKGLLLLLSVLMVLNFIRYIYLLQGQQLLDIRQLSWFGSHIRFGVLVAFSVALCLHLMLNHLLTKRFALPYLLLSTGYVIYSQTFSAIGCLLLLYLYLGTTLLDYNRMSRIILALVGGIGMVLAVLLVNNFLNPPPSCGSFYDAKQASFAWNKRSTFAFFGKDRKGQNLQRTCERYLCSQGMPLTPHQMNQLEPSDIKNIENGFTDPFSARGSILARYHELKYEFHTAVDPNGHSLLQRLEYWRTAWKIIVQNPLTGVGVGDVDKALKKAYANSALMPEYQKRPHNMFLTTWLGCGLLGVLLLLGLLTWQLFIGIAEQSKIKTMLMMVLIFSMLLEDSLETQAGASFAGLFLGMVLCKEALPLWTFKND